MVKLDMNRPMYIRKMVNGYLTYKSADKQNDTSHSNTLCCYVTIRLGWDTIEKFVSNDKE